LGGGKKQWRDAKYWTADEKLTSEKRGKGGGSPYEEAEKKDSAGRSEKEEEKKILLARGFMVSRGGERAPDTGKEKTRGGGAYEESLRQKGHRGLSTPESQITKN